MRRKEFVRLFEIMKISFAFLCAILFDSECDAMKLQSAFPQCECNIFWECDHKNSFMPNAIRIQFKQTETKTAKY